MAMILLRKFVLFLTLCLLVFFPTTVYGDTGLKNGRRRLSPENTDKSSDQSNQTRYGAATQDMGPAKEKNSQDTTARESRDSSNNTVVETFSGAESEGVGTQVTSPQSGPAGTQLGGGTQDASKNAVQDKERTPVLTHRFTFRANANIGVTGGEELKSHLETACPLLMAIQIGNQLAPSDIQVVVSVEPIYAPSSRMLRDAADADAGLLRVPANTRRLSGQPVGYSATVRYRVALKDTTNFAAVKSKMEGFSAATFSMTLQEELIKRGYNTANLEMSTLYFGAISVENGPVEKKKTKTYPSQLHELVELDWDIKHETLWIIWVATVLLLLATWCYMCYVTSGKRAPDEILIAQATQQYSTNRHMTETSSYGRAPGPNRTAPGPSSPSGSMEWNGTGQYDGMGRREWGADRQRERAGPDYRRTGHQGKRGKRDQGGWDGRQKGW